MEVKLTKDADKLICLIYEDYLFRREHGVSKASAKAYAETTDWPKSLTDEFSRDDVRDTLRELKAAGFVWWILSNISSYCLHGKSISKRNFPGFGLAWKD